MVPGFYAYLEVHMCVWTDDKNILLYSMRSMGESIGIGLEASSTSKGPQAKTTVPMDSTKVTYCSIQLGWILARDGFAKNAMGSRPEAKKCQFFI